MLIIYLQAQKEDLSNKQHPKVSKLPPILCQATPTLLHALCVKVEGFRTKTNRCCNWYPGMGGEGSYCGGEKSQSNPSVRNANYGNNTIT